MGSSFHSPDTLNLNFLSQVTCTELLSNPLSVSSVFFINVQDVNEAPYNLTISSQSVSENQVTGYFVGMLSVLDPDLPVGNWCTRVSHWTAFVLTLGRSSAVEIFRFWDEDDYEYEIFSGAGLSSACAWASVILAGKRDSRRHSITSFSENVVVAGTIIKF